MCLHSKLYLGKQSALLGSPNLSENSFADLGRFEVGVVMTEPNDLEQLDEIFEYYKKLAINLYATPESKQEKLKLLKKQLETANSNNINTLAMLCHQLLITNQANIKYILFGIYQAIWT